MEKTALLIVDAQNETFDDASPVYKATELLENLQSLVGKARLAKVPVVFVQHNNEVLVSGTHDWEIHPSISPKAGETVVQKRNADAFQDTNLQEELKAKGIQHVIVAGNQTESCIDETCRHAADLGYKVTLVKDGHGTWDTEALSAQQIIDRHNEALSSVADVKATTEIQFSS